MVTALNRFIRRSSDLCRPFFRAITTSRRRFVWTEECEQALQSLKQYLSHAPLLVKPLPDEDLYLYLAISDHATSAVLVRKEGMEHQPIFYSRKTMTDSQMRYLPMETLALALVSAKTSLLPYFQSHRIVFEPRTAIKGQALADFFAELTPGLQDEANALATAAEEARIQEEEVLEGPCNRPVEPLRARGTVHESVVSIGYPATNNEEEYEALIAGLQLALRLDADSVHVFCDSQLIMGHLNDDYQAKDQRMNAYVSHVLALFGRFGRVEVEWIAREHNAHADALTGLASIYRTSGGRIITFDEVAAPSFEQPFEPVMAISLCQSQLDPMIDYLKNQVLPPNKREAYKLRCRAANFFLDPNDNLYRRTFTGPDLRVVHDDLVPAVLEELHSGSCGAHSGGRSLAQRALTQGYWWPKMVKQSEEYVKQCVQCQKQVFEYMLTATDLFTKWVEASPLVKTTAGDVERFIWKHIISRFGVPYAILSDNGSQFVASAIKTFYAKRHITIHNSSVAYPQGNGQAEASNKTITRGLKRRLDRKLDFAEELRDNANLRHAAYQQEVARGYNRNVRACPFNVGDLVLRMVTEASKLTKLKDPYERPYRVVEKIGHGVYKLAEMDGTPIANPWNAQKLRKFHG
ncbi:uncharacterized protein LOC131328958 [Rhododendron vialii]|uniref:uncharacterized protein LOC131328958 n=1 Tax=Rhododendron vialii TaxID=182163 RepID=UPI00265DA513|nr:uncharacterized protein LOC131328958 [Rhododendron vialii]